ncbi:hypothetical protein [Kamptonema formosum]|nr:hypothetical protein [Oscillatoria sp. PCC 10802]
MIGISPIAGGSTGAIGATGELVSIVGISAAAGGSTGKLVRIV